ncbi:hypothetical protein Q604_UNBC15484G0001, partial [human gut metagenome]
GLAYVPEELVSDDIEQGALIRVLQCYSQRLEDLRADRLIAPMAVGDECPTTPNRLLYNPVLSLQPLP